MNIPKLIRYATANYNSFRTLKDVYKGIGFKGYFVQLNLGYKCKK